MSPSIVPIHPFNPNQKIFTDENSISLMLRMINVFNAPDMKYTFEGDDFPSKGIDLNKHKLFYIEMVAKEDAFNLAVNKLYENPNVVAIFYHKGLDHGSSEGRTIYALMKDEASARRLVGMS